MLGLLPNEIPQSRAVFTFERAEAEVFLDTLGVLRDRRLSGCVLVEKGLSALFEPQLLRHIQQQILGDLDRLLPWETASQPDER